MEYSNESYGYKNRANPFTYNKSIRNKLILNENSPSFNSSPVNIAEKRVLLNPIDLKHLIDSGSVILVDTRDPQTYQRGHIPGAVNIPSIFSYLSTQESGGLDSFVTYFEKTLGEAGIDENDFVVLYEDTLSSGYGQSCRGYFILDYLGHQKKAVLHGGYQDWIDGGYPSTTEYLDRPKTTYHAALNSDVIVTLEQMRASLSNQSIVKLDCRDYNEWAGLAASPYTPDFDIPKGRIPGAVWLEWTKLMEEKANGPRFADNEKILAACAEVGITPDTPVFVYCFKGSRSSNTMLALKKAGIKIIRNYFGSWNEWARDPSLPKDSQIKYD